MKGEVRINKGKYNQSISKERKDEVKDGLRENKKTRNKGINKKKYINTEDQNAICNCQGQKDDWEIEMKLQRKKNQQIRTSKKSMF